MNHFKQKMSLVCDLKHFLELHRFNEVLTPVLRKDSGSLIKRIGVTVGGALRDSHELQLRYLLSYYDSLYEIGSCFRDEETETKAQEFLLMELFSSKHSLDDLMELTKQFILQQKPEIVFEQISIAELIDNMFNIDLFSGQQKLLFQKLKQKYSHEHYPNDYEYVIHYIEEEVEPLSKGKVVFLTDYPECTCSYANIKKGDVINRFELFANGLELANGFEDECSPNRFIERNSQLPIFKKEEETIVRMLSDGSLPSKSAGVGIGIERLCMFLLDSKSIVDFAFPSNDF